MPEIEQLTCIWMLTPPTANNDGRKAFIAHPEQTRLTSFFQVCRARGIANVRAMKTYFADQQYRFFSYRDRADQYFGINSRLEYFRGIPDIALSRSIVFFDPDNGLEPAGKATAAHLRYEELAVVFGRMDADSIAVVYQHLPRIEGSRFWPSVASAVHKHLGRPVAYIAERDLAFLVIPRRRTRMKSILSILKNQAQIVPPGKPLRRIAVTD